MTYRVRWTVMKDSVEQSSELMDARFREREEAAAYVATLQIKYKNRGYDRTQDRWWGKDDDETWTRLWSIETDADDRLISDVFKDAPASVDKSGWQEAKQSSQKGYQAGLKAIETDRAARAIIDIEKSKRDSKTTRLKAEREAAEAAMPKAEPKKRVVKETKRKG